VQATTLKRHLPAIACAVIPLFCYFLIRPYAEIGIGDDWSYIKSSQVLARSGHIVYNGWATAMLGWQLYVGALFIKLFGLSFTAVRLSTVIEAMATAYLLQRTCVRAGLNSWNATLATLTFVLSPLYFPLAYTFKTDVSGMLCIVACLYMCLRAVQAQSERSAMAWICSAALVNAVGGTVRQILWLGLLVMVPCTLWLLRKSRRVLVAGCVSWFIGVVFVAAAMHWFARQPYTIPVSLFPITMDRKSLISLGDLGVRSAGQLALLALPVLLMFSGALRLWNRRAAAVFGAGLLFIVVLGIALIRARKLDLALAPFLLDSMTDSSSKRLSAMAVLGIHPGPARDGLGVLLTGAIALGILCLAVCVIAGPHWRATLQQETGPISWPKLGILLGSFSAAYIVIVAFSELRTGLFFDRYLLPPLAILLLVLTRYYQERVKAKLSRTCVLLIVVFGAFSVAATHDTFALYRGYATAIHEIRSSGAPATAIAGPWEFEGWTQIEKVGYMNDSRIRVPRGAYVPQPVRAPRVNCSVDSSTLGEVPAIEPAYVVSSNPGDCGGQDAFPPVMYSTWIAPRINWIYALKLPADFPR
jgi:riboflavin transporter FmnP